MQRRRDANELGRGRGGDRPLSAPIQRLEHYHRALGWRGAWKAERACCCAHGERRLGGDGRRTASSKTGAATARAHTRAATTPKHRLTRLKVFCRPRRESGPRRQARRPVPNETCQARARGNGWHRCVLFGVKQAESSECVDGSSARRAAFAARRACPDVGTSDSLSLGACGLVAEGHVGTLQLVPENQTS
jgi:hypothetical protein